MRSSLSGLIKIAGVVLLQVATFATAQTVLYDKSRVSCVSRQMNVPVEAQFKKFTARIAFDPARPEAGNAQIEIDVGSFDIDNAEVNDEAKSKPWFDVRAFPKATFVSTKIEPGGGTQSFNVTGNFDLHGVKKSISFPATINVTPNTVTVSAEFSINRKDFGIVYAGKADDLIRDGVVIKLSLNVARKK